MTLGNAFGEQVMVNGGSNPRLQSGDAGAGLVSERTGKVSAFKFTLCFLQKPEHGAAFMQLDRGHLFQCDGIFDAFLADLLQD